MLSRRINSVAGILAALLLSGCLLAQIHQLEPGQTLSPEQIKAYKEMNMNVYGCFQIGGPPPAGNTVWIVVPKEMRVLPKFGDNCHVMPG